MVEDAPSEDDYNDMIIATLAITDNNQTEVKRAVAEFTGDFWEPEVTSLEDRLTLSRACQLIAYLSSSDETDTFEAHRQQQNEDSDIAWTKDLILQHRDETPTLLECANPTRRVFFKEYKNLRLINGVLYLQREDNQGGNSLHYVLPIKVIDKVLETIHTSVYGAHLGRKKTKTKVLARFYRPFLSDKIETFVKTCDTCQKIKTLKPRTRANMMIIKPEHTNQLIASDFAGPLNTSKRGNKYFQVIVDLFSKYLVVVAHPNKETRSAIKGLTEYWCWTFGIPESCLTDGGKEYQSELWDMFCEKLDIERLKTSIFHPECDGQSERAVQTIKRMIAAYVNDNTIGTFTYHSSSTPTIQEYTEVRIAPRLSVCLAGHPNFR